MLIRAVRVKSSCVLGASPLHPAAATRLALAGATAAPSSAPASRMRGTPATAVQQ